MTGSRAAWVRAGRGMAAASVLGVGASWCAAGDQDGESPAPAATEMEFRSRDAGVEGDLAELVQRLDSPEFMVRQEASTAIITDSRFTLKMVEKALSDPALSPEQRQRLRHVQKHRFVTTDRAGMGVGFALQLLPHRVVLERTIAPFKSTELLEPGDLILSADGINLRSTRASELMRMVIISHDPGDEIELEVARGEERLTINVPLGRYNELRNPNPLDSDDIERAWRVRLARTPDPGREPIATGLAMPEWAAMDAASQDRARLRNANAARSGLNVVPPRLLVAGGRPRPPFIDEGEFAKFNLVRDKNELNFEDMQMLRIQEMRNLEAQLEAVREPQRLEDEIDRVTGIAELAREQLARIEADGAAGRSVNELELEQAQQSLKVTERVLRALLQEQQGAGKD